MHTDISVGGHTENATETGARERHLLVGGRVPRHLRDIRVSGLVKIIQANISVTLDLYSHVLPDMQEEAVDRLEALLS